MKFVETVTAPRTWAAPALLGLLLVVPSSVQAQTGTIKGRLVFGGANPPAPKKLDTTKEPLCSKDPLYAENLVVDPKTKGVKNGFAYLPKPTGKNAEAAKAMLAKEPKVEIDQKNCRFLPHSTALMQTQTLVFKSSDPVGHNAHYTGFTNSKNVALAPNGKDEQKLVKESRPIPLKCDIHPWMEGWIMVFDHPFFAVTDDDGSFEITGVPAGTQNLVVWQEAVGYVTAGGSKGLAVTVKDGQTTDLGEIKLDPAKVKK